MNLGLKVSTKKPTETWDESGLKVSTKKPTKTWDELGIKGEQYETHRNLGWTRD